MTTAVEWTPKARAVLAAADELFYAHGIHAVGVDAVAERAGVTKKTLYDRFGSKERLVVEYLAGRDREWRAHLEAHLGESEQTPQEQLVAVFEASDSWARAHSGKGCSMINAHAEISDPANPAYTVIIEQKRWMLALFTDLTAAAAVADPARVAEQVMLVHEGALVTAGMGVVADAFVRAAEVASALLAAAARRPRGKRSATR
jgi:AcrR family transcriptional regulator